MEQFAHFLMVELDLKLPTGTMLSDISQHSYRYSMYKVGPVLSISHGMGMPSISILLHEVIKLLYHAKVVNPVFFRIGTCGGIGIDGGNLIVSTEAVDGELNPFYELTVLGKKVRRPAELDAELVDELMELANPDDPWQTECGKTMCTNDFYEGQGRMDGAFCKFTEEDKMDFLKMIRNEGVVNMEMESLAFAAQCQYAKIKAAVVCVALLNRLHGDQHGMGMPSISILLHEVIKLLYHAKVVNPVFFRIGTCGGIGIDGGNLIVSTEAVDGELNPFYELTVLGKKVRRPAELDAELVDELMELANPDDPWQTECGKTMCTNDFYEGQGRMDGAFCKFTEEDKMDFLKMIRNEGVVNMEMESLAFAAQCQYAKIKAAVVCVALLNRLHGDQVASPKEVLEEWQTRPQKLVARYIKKQLGIGDKLLSPLETMTPVPSREKFNHAMVSPRKLRLVTQESMSYE
ncbi:unnamed protein product [Notodromas monacha]|uniref:Nucleoside phosphorylase domain-containing protein n=1 Tax=Notodromas monacha TaxID=399045 RepID=A0A7R9BQH7_9CRUS|nr:unnamed protein product [Notodromas monacha]CAG0919594.1 unnamed protein product [Notodromas monacha]